jgi:hypothetical protein
LLTSLLLYRGSGLSCCSLAVNFLNAIFQIQIYRLSHQITSTITPMKNKPMKIRLP